MPIGWVIMMIVLWIAFVVLAIVVLGILRQVIPVLEQVAVISAPETVVLGPPIGTRLQSLPLPEAEAGAIEERLRDCDAVLLFLTPGCGPCQLLADEMNQMDITGLVHHLIIVTTPDGPRELGIPTRLSILTEKDREISDPLSVAATPFAIAVSQDGVIRAVRTPHTVEQVTGLTSVIA